MSVVFMAKQGPVAIIKINRPEAMNALNDEVLTGISEAVAVANEDREIQVLIFTGEGKAFVAGADIAAMSKMNYSQAYEFGNIGQQAFRQIEKLSKPTIAAVNGFALGGGCELALACDMRIASEKAKFGQPEVGLGIIPGFSGTQRLSRVVGKARAIELITTGDMINAQQALEMGLVNKVVPPEALMEEAMNLAERITKNAPIAVQCACQAVKEGLEQKDMDAAIAVEARLFGKCFDTADQKEGMAAFLEKRKPVFRGE